MTVALNDLAKIITFLKTKKQIDLFFLFRYQIVKIARKVIGGFPLYYIKILLIIIEKTA